MKKLTASIMFIFIFLAAMLNAQDKSINTDDEYRDPWIEAYAGLGYYNWNFSGGSSVDTDVDPYILKKFEIKGDLRILKVGLNYFTNRFDNMFNTTDEADVARENDPLARQLALLAGVGLGPVVISADAKFRKFQGTVTSKGIDVSGGNVDVRVYTASGPEDLPAGTELTWYSLVRDYTLKLGMPWRRRTGANFAMEFGGRMVKYSTPVDINIEEHGGGFGSGKMHGLFVSDITQYFIGCSFWMNYTWANGFYWDWALPAYLGANKIENPYLEMGPGNTYTFSTTGKIASGYRTGNVRIELGLDYDFFISNSMYTTRLKQDVVYNTFSGTDTITKGTLVDADFVRMELFWGLYLHASLMW